MSIIRVVILILVGSTGSTLAKDWATYRGDAARSGYTDETIPNGLTLRWVYRSPHAPRPAWATSPRIDFDLVFQPIIMGDLVLFGSSVDDQVRAIDAKTGEIRWTFFTGAPVRFAPTGWKDRVFVVSDDGWLYALSLKDGSVIWKHRGGPSDEKVLGNERIVSKWPARGGPVVLDDTVYFSAGIWPSDGVYLHALDAKTGKVIWSNSETGKIFMKQPHGGAEATSGVSAQGYLVANEGQLLVPTGRAVPAAFDRSDGKLQYYQLAKNQKRGGSRALIVDQFVLNSGCLFDLKTGEMASQIGLGSAVALSNGIVQSDGKSLTISSWKTEEVFDRKGQAKKVRSLEEKKLTALDREVLEFIVTGSEAVVGQDGQVCAIDYSGQQTIWWTHEVEGKALGLAAGNGSVVVSTDKGLIYCFDGDPGAAVEVKEKKGKAKTHTNSQAASIIEMSKITNGFAVVVGQGADELALSLAEISDLQLYVVEDDKEKVDAARKLLSEAEVYGNRVTVIEADPKKTHLPDDFANLLVYSTTPQKERKDSMLQKEFERLKQPYNGDIRLIGMEAGTIWSLSGGIVIGVDGVVKKSPLVEDGRGNWTHQNASPANKLCSDDSVIKGPLSMLWFRDVEFEIPNRHGQGPAPLVSNGYMVVGGVDGLICLDAFNGHTIWTFDLKDNLKDYDGIHHDVAVGEAGSNFCLSDDAVFVRNGERCLRIELATGKLAGEFTTPVSDKKKANRNWGYLAYHEGTLFGSVLNDAHRVSPRYKLTTLRTESVSFFAMNAKTGELKWEFKPKGSIRNNAIAISGKRVIIIDRPVVDADKIANPKRGQRQVGKTTADKIPSGTLIAFNANTGKELWRNEDDIFGTQLAVSEQHSTILMNYQAVSHKFFGLPSEIGGRLAGFNLETGKQNWSKKAEYKTRPIINDYTIYAQGGTWNLLTGEDIKFDFQRSYGCGQIASSKHLMLFRSATLGYRDLTRDAGTENYGGIRPSCWINAIPANGLVLVPDGSSKCNCSYQMKAWFALQPAK